MIFPNAKLKTQQCEESSMLVVSTEYLRSKLLHLNSNIAVIPNAVDFKLWKPTGVKNKQITIGWEGGAGHGPDLEIIEEMTTEVVIVRQKTPLVVCRQSIQTPVVITEEMTNEVVIVDLEIIEEMTNEVVIVDLIITEEMVNNLEIN